MEETNAGNMVFDPEVMYQIVTGNYVPSENDPPPESFGGNELSFIRGVDMNTFEYSGVIYDSAMNGSTTVDYPNSDIATQLALTSKLFSGQELASGLYFIQVDVEGTALTQKVTLLK